MVRTQYFFIALLIVVSIMVMPTAADVVTEQFNTTLNGTMSSDISESGDVMAVGCVNGTIYLLNSTGGTVWATNTGGNVTKVVLNPSATKIVSLSGSSAYYIDASNGNVLGTYTNGTLNDVDLSKNGSNWLVTCNKTFTVLNATNNTIYARNMSENVSDTGNWVYGILDPQGEYVVTSNSNGHIDKWIYQTGSSAWYQGYQYRIVHSIQGSTAGYLNRWNGTSIRIFNVSGSNTGGDIYIGANKTRADWNDVRIVSPGTGLAYQIYINERGANYVNISPIFDNLTASTSYDLYIYYGNASASTDVSNGTNMYGEELGHIYVPGWIMDNASVSFEASKIGNWTKLSNTTIYHYNFGSNTSWKADSGTASTMLQAIAWGYSETSYRTTPIPGINGSFGYKNVEISSHYEANSNATATATNYSYGYLVKYSGGNSIITWYQGLVGTYTNNSTINCMGVGDSIQMEAISQTVPTPPFYSYASIFVDNITLHRNVSPLPQHSSTGAEQSIPFGTQLQGTIDTNTTARIDISWDSTWIGAATITKIYNIEITSSGFGTIYSDAATGNVYSLKAGDGCNYVAEGRGIKTNIYEYGATLDGSLGSGNSVITADIAELSGLHVISGSLDNHIRYFTLGNSTSWVYYWDGPVASQPTSTAFTESGGYFMYTLADGSVYYYATVAGANITTTITNTYLTINVYRNGFAYQNADLRVYDGGTTGSSFVSYKTGRADSSGTYTFLATVANVYRVDLYENESVVKSITIHANALGQFNIIYTTGYTVTNHSVTDTNVSFVGTTIILNYPSDIDTLHVMYNVTEMDTSTRIYSNDHTEFPINISISVSNTTSTYYIDRRVEYKDHTWFNITTPITSYNRYYVATPLDEGPAAVKYIVTIIMLILILGLFSVVKQMPVGLVMLSVMGWACIVFGFLPRNAEVALGMSVITILAAIYWQMERI